MKGQRGGRVPTGSLKAPQRLLLHLDSPGIRGQNLGLFLHQAGIGALVDGIGDDAHVVLVQRQVARVGIFQELLVFIPAKGYETKKKNGKETIRDG